VCNSLLCFFRKQIVLYLPGVGGQDTVSQSPLTVTVAEKEQVIISCSTTESQASQWYRQNPNQALKHLVTGQTGEQQKKRIRATMNYREKGSNLSITPADYCALSPTEAQISGSALQKLPCGFL
uniref:Immunoglobulin V-set domain-containing protein n=1 Tax=Callorhinchus milii TaxID=7868 RepID=A0A4W3ISE5_CALMI